MPNRGVAPPDPETEVGQLRLFIGDVIYVELDPPEVGYGDYTNFSDDQLNQFLAQGGSLMRAAGYAYLQLATAAAAQAITVTSDDLRIELTERAAQLRQIANLWLEQADNQQGSQTVDYIDLVQPFPRNTGCKDWPELSMRPWGRWHW